MAEVYQVRSGASPWSFAKEQLEKEGKTVTNAMIAKRVQELPSIYGCKSLDEFQRKYFRANTSFEIKGQSASKSGSVFAHSRRDTIARSHIDSMGVVKSDAIPDSHRIARQDSQQFVKRDSQKPSDSEMIAAGSRYIQTSSTHGTDLRSVLNRKSWNSIKAVQDRINALPSDKQKIIEYHRQFKDLKDNYVIVDKKNFTATVYSPDGKVVKQYEIGVARNESDRLLRRSKRNPQNSFASTSAGIYTANYRANGRDAYRRLYNNRVLTLSNDGLKDKGVGNGETGVAFHQIPNGNTARRAKLEAPGVSKQNNRFSAGCVNFLPEDFDDCMQHIKGVGTKVYILPEESNNYMCVKNGKLHFTQKEYTGNVATTTTKKDPVKPVKIASKRSDMRQEGLDMASTLSSQKAKLSKDLGLDNDTYNDLAMLALGIAGQETKWGHPLAGAREGKPYWVKENAKWAVDFGKDLKGNTSFNSRGLTQMKLKSFTDPEVKRLFNKYGITEDNLNQGDKAAVATMIVLSHIYKNELPGMKEQMAKLNVSKTDALLYCYNSRKYEITRGTATPARSEYLQNVYNYMNYFEMSQSVA